MSESNGYASREQFLAPARRRYLDVVPPVSGLKLRIRSLLESEKEAYEAAVLNAKGDLIPAKLRDARRRLIALCLCDQNGDRMLSDADVDALQHLDGADIGFLQEKCQKHIGFSDGDIEGLVGNSGGVPVGSLPTD